jgi:histidinol dehydrogenase
MVPNKSVANDRGDRTNNVLRVQVWADMDASSRAQLLRRGTDAIFDPKLQESIGRILEDVRLNGDEAVCRALRDFDRVSIDPSRLRVTSDEIDRAVASLDAALLAAIRDMVDHIRRFNDEVMTRKAQDWRIESEPGLFVGEKVTPIHSAGLFCPSGKASYPSVLAHIGTPATVAGVPTRVVITPPIPGDATAGVDAATLAVARELGLTDIFRVNGPAGVGAVAF